MSKSIRTRRAVKPAKPHPDFPLFPHPNGLWAKKISGRAWYFGPWRDDRQGVAALAKYQKEIPAILNGEDPRAQVVEGYTAAKLCNDFLNAKQAKLAQGKIRPAHFADLFQACARLTEFFGPGRLIETIGPDDFEKLDQSFPATWRLRRRKREIGNTRSLFVYAVKKEKLTRTRFGTFAVPSKDELKAERFTNERKNGKGLFTAEQLRTILDAAPLPLKAMIYLGLNCGLGNTDISELTKAYVDLDGRWLSFPRIKTSVERRSYLWPETVTAIREAIAGRPKPLNAADDNLVFLSKTGRRWVRVEIKKNVDGKITVNGEDCVSKAFAALLKKLGIKRLGLSFYRLRHHVETYGGIDQTAINCVMGHIGEAMPDNYRHGVPDDRLIAVSESIRTWLFGVDYQ